MQILTIAALLALPLLAILAGLSDLTSYRISNRLTAACALAFIPAALILHVTPVAFGTALLVGFGILAAGVGMFAAGWIGGGDAKLLAACALWMGLPGVLPFLMWTGIGGGLLAVALLVLRRQPYLAALPAPGWARRLITHGESVPYGVAIAAGALIAFPGSLAAVAAHV